VTEHDRESRSKPPRLHEHCLHDSTGQTAAAVWRTDDHSTQANHRKALAVDLNIDLDHPR